MIQSQIELRLSSKQEKLFSDLKCVWNWVIRKIEQDGKDEIYYKKLDFQNIFANHSTRVEIPSHTLEAAWVALDRYQNAAINTLIAGLVPSLEGAA